MLSHASSSPPVSPRLSATGVIAIWLVTRAALLALTLGWFQGDTGTYFEQGRRWLGGERPYLDYPVEYPPGAALLFAGLVALARIFGDDLATFRIVFVLACLVCDAALAWMLARVPAADPEGRPSRGPVLAHAAIGLCLYPIWLVRFDLFPSVFVLLAALMVARPASNLRSGARAGLALGLGIALKLYPVLLFFPWLVGLARSLFPSTISHQPAASETRSRAFAAQLRFLIVVGGAAALVVVISFAPAWLAGAGPAVFSFLDYHRGRGLQIESTYASALALLTLIRPQTAWHVASHHAHDLAGPAADALVALARWVQPAAIVVTAWLAGRRRLPLVQTWAALLAAALVSASVFSPQFLAWLFPLALFASATNWRLRDAALPVAIAALTTVIFPLVYQDLIAGRWFAVGILLFRNSLLVLLARDLLRPRVAQHRALS